MEKLCRKIRGKLTGYLEDKVYLTWAGLKKKDQDNLVDKLYTLGIKWSSNDTLVKDDRRFDDANFLVLYVFENTIELMKNSGVPDEGYRLFTYNEAINLLSLESSLHKRTKELLNLN